MDWWQVVLLALLQGVTEFLPISSSAHLILPGKLLGWQDQGLAFDVAVHVGTLLAVMWYFRVRLLGLFGGVCLSVRHRQSNFESLLFLQVCLAILPAAIVGFLLSGWIETQLRSLTVIVVTTIAFGLLLGIADSITRGNRTLVGFTYQAALLVGIAQVFALIPGTSRSGVTITAALFCGFSRQASAEFSFLLSIPIILAAGCFKTIELMSLPVLINWSQLLLATTIAGISAYGCIEIFLKLLDRIGMWPFVWYRLALAAFLLVI